MANTLLKKAAENSPAASKRGLMERLFTLMFQGFVYNQIWEDPDVDLRAMRVGPETRILTIASGGCNILNYLAAGPKSITAVDLNPNHLALTRLKLAAVERFPDYETFFRFFAEAQDGRNVEAYHRYLEPHLDEETRRHWNGRMGLFRKRIDMFRRGLYRYSLLGNFIGLLHFGARAFYGIRPQDMLKAKTAGEQRAIFQSSWARVFDKGFVRWISSKPFSYYLLGIPPQQFDELAAASNGNPAGLLRARIEKLACDFPIESNYFAWQAFSRHYDTEKRLAVPGYLRREAFEALRGQTGRVSVHHVIMTEFLAGKPADSFDRYVLLDAQDWMNEVQITELWNEITRTAAPDARVIFRTAGHDSPLERKLPPEILNAWRYDADESEAGHRADRSSIYGGFHVYVKKA